MGTAAVFWCGIFEGGTCSSDSKPKNSLAANEALDVKDGTLRVEGRLKLGGVPYQALRVGEGNIGGRDSVALVVGDDLYPPILVHAHAGVLYQGQIVILLILPTIRFWLSGPVDQPCQCAELKILRTVVPRSMPMTVPSASFFSSSFAATQPTTVKNSSDKVAVGKEASVAEAAR